MNVNRSAHKSGAAQAETRRLLLEAAGEVFAEAGFRAATVRAICHRAGANIAAINYHFGDKERLYLEVLRYAHTQALAQHPLAAPSAMDAPIEQRLKTFVHSLFLRMLARNSTAWQGKLLAREMIEPTGALDTVIEERIRPMAEQLGEIIGQALALRAEAELVRLCGCSIVSQCVFYCHCQSVVTRLFPEQEYGPADLERLAEHITQFSLAALRHFADGAKGCPTPRAGPTRRHRLTSITR